MAFLEEIIYKVYYLGQKSKLRDYVILAISSLSVGCRNIVPSLSFERFMGVFYAFLYRLSYRDKVIIKGVSNIIGIGYSITIIKR